MGKSFAEFRQLDEGVRGEGNKILSKIKKLRGRIDPDVLELAIDLFELWLKVNKIKK